MSTPAFTQPARSNLLAPVLIAFLVLGIAIALILRYTPSKTADLSITRTAVYPTHTVYKANSIVVGHGEVQDNLYVLITLHIDDRLHLPLFLKDFTATLVTADGQELTTSAAEQQDLPNLFTAFPALKPLATESLARETLIEPGQSAEGMVLLHFPVTQDTWNHRRSATLNVDLYHQDQQSILIEPTTEVITHAATPALPPAKPATEQ